MKTLVFADGIAVEILECYSAREYVLDTKRDVLDFRFDPAAHSLGEVDAMFSAEQCSRLTIREVKTVVVPVVDEEGNPVYDENGEVVTEEKEVTEEFVHDGYCIRTALAKQLYTLAIGNDVKTVEQISVKMGKQTAAEAENADLQAKLANAVTEEELTNAYVEGVNSL